MKYTVELDGKVFKGDMIESVEYRIENARNRGDLRVFITINGIVPINDSDWQSLVRDCSKDDSVEMYCKVACIDDDDRVIRQYEINEIFYRDYNEFYNHEDGRARFALTLVRLRYNNEREMMDVMVFNEDEI